MLRGISTFRMLFQHTCVRAHASTCAYSRHEEDFCFHVPAKYLLPCSRQISASMFLSSVTQIVLHIGPGPIHEFEPTFVCLNYRGLRRLRLDPSDGPQRTERWQEQPQLSDVRGVHGRVCYRGGTADRQHSNGVPSRWAIACARLPRPTA